MAPALWLFLGLAGRLTAALSGPQPPATTTPGQHNASSSEAPEPGLGVRLANRSSHCHGEVEARLGARWAPACAAQWDHQAAEAVCRALGCGGAEATPESEPRTPVGNASAANATRAGALTVRCRGPEWELCEVVDVACGGDAGPARVTCAEARALRLVGGAGPCAGRVEMLERGAWGTVCDDAWDLRDAHVACRQLGCGWAVEAAPGLRFPAGRGRIHRDEVACAGDEAQLWDCAGRPGDGYCGHKEDAGVVCSGGRARVRAGAGGGPGRRRGSSTPPRAPGCRGPNGGCSRVRPGALLQPELPMRVRGVRAARGGRIPAGLREQAGRREGTRTPGVPRLWAAGPCARRALTSRSPNPLSQEHQSWRLTGGGDRCEGQVEVHFRGVWSTVCDSEWYGPEADVLCRALGCGRAEDRPPGQPHSLPGKMFYSCKGEEATPSLCVWRFNNSNLCRQSRAARVLCSGSQARYNLSSPPGTPSVQPVTVESLVTVKTEKEPGARVLLVLSLVLGVLLLGALVALAVVLLRVKGKYALPATGNHQHLLPAIPAGSNNYHAVPITVPKEEAPQLLSPGRAPSPEDSSSDSGSDYEHYDFSAQPPVALTTFYNSQRHRVSEAEAQQSRFQMPPLVEGLEELHTPPMPATLPGPCASDATPGDLRHHQGGGSGSSTSSGEDYCNSPRSKLPPWSPHAFPPELAPGLELAGSQMPFPGGGPPADDSSSTSSGEWYQNFQSPSQPRPTEQFECPGPQPDDSSSGDDYDDIGAA